jgi:hypothetical protein
MMPNAKFTERLFKTPFWPLGAILFITLFFYFRVVDFAYVRDDTDILFGRIDALVKADFSLYELGKPFMTGMDYFRPLVVLTYYLDVSIAGFDPGFSHAVNLLIFILNIALVFSICRVLAEKTGRHTPIFSAFLAALIYAIHPAMIEATVWISGRFDLLVTFFVLIATRIYLGKTKPALKIVLVSGATLLSLLCKETGAVFPMTILGLWIATHLHEQKDRHFYGKALRENAGFLGAFCLVFVLYLAMRLNVEGNAYLQRMDQINLAYLAEKGFLALESIKLYLVLSFLPFWSISVQHPVDYAFPAWSMGGVMGNLLTLAILGGVSYFAIRKRSLAAWLFIVGLTYLFLVLHIIPFQMGKNLAHERYLEVTLAFWVMAMVLVRYDQILSSSHLQKIFSSMHVLSARNLLQGTVLCWILFSMLTTYLTIPVWKNSLSLWSWTYSLYPKDWFTRTKYALALLSADRPDLLKQEIRAMKEDMKDSENKLLYGHLLLADRDPEALPLLRSIVEKNPGDLSESQIASALSDTLDTEAMPFFEGSPTKAMRFVEEAKNNDALSAALSYSLYAEATLLFEKDPAKAMQFAEKAKDYAGRVYGEKQVKLWLGFREIAILYAMGKFDAGDALKAEIVAFSGNPEAMDASVSSILQYYCQENPACAEIEARKLLLQIPAQ